MSLTVPLLQLFLIFVSTCVASGHENTPLLLVISFDAFRWDYLEVLRQNGSFSTPNFDYFVQNGVTIDNGGMVNSFMTVTFPNHYSIATGMYQENHGIVDNEFFDPILKEKVCFYCGTPIDDPVWYNNGTEGTAPEPIWVTNQVRNNNPLNPHHSAVDMWPGAAMKMDNPKHIPKYSFPWKENVSFIDRVDRAVGWFEKKEVNFVMLYFPEPDETSHKYGPDSYEVFEIITELDYVLGHLKDKLEKLGVFDMMNIIITSDHGMVKMADDPFIDLREYIPVEVLQNVHGYTVQHIFPEPEQEEQVYQKLKKVKHVTVYKKDEIPEKYHYRYNRRIGPIIVVADPGYQVTSNKSSITHTNRGGHGYSNNINEMHPIFIASGPEFKRGAKVKQFNNVDIYPLMCHVLEVEPAAHDGSFNNIKDVLKSTSFIDKLTSVPMLVAVLTLIFVILVGFLFMFGVFCNRFTQKPQRLYLDHVDEEDHISFAAGDGIRLLNKHGKCNDEEHE